jgi:hypothetical protein
MTLRKREVLEIERGSTSSHCLENSLWKRLRTCHKADYAINEICGEFDWLRNYWHLKDAYACTE